MTPDEPTSGRPPRSFGRTLLYVMIVQAVSLLFLWALQAHYNV
jgi:hypothetical protein